MYNELLELPDLTVSGDASSSVIDVRNASELTINVNLPSTGTPNGVLYVRGSNYRTSSGLTRPMQIYLDANKVYGEVDGSVYAHTGGAGITITGSDDTFLGIPLSAGLFKFFDLFWDWSSGTGTLSTKYLLKSV